jgi:hypothetical protein
MALVATVSDEGNRGTEAELAGSVHRVLAILTDRRADVLEPELGDRIALVRWLRGELAAVEKLLTDSQQLRTAASTVSVH